MTARIERLDEAHKGEIETVRARYRRRRRRRALRVREALGFKLVGDYANQAWGVMDVLAVTDFPDIRKKCVIQSEREGNILVIPREGGYMLRIYVEMDKLAENERVTNRAITLDDIVGAASAFCGPTPSRRSRSPGGRSTRSASASPTISTTPRPTAGARDPRVFIMGDACHTHSAKAGQGLNVSVQDAFNLGWKLAAVLRGPRAASLLSTYSAERRAIAQNLIDFDREWAAMMAAPLKSPQTPHGVDPADLQAYFVQHGRYTAGVVTRYAPSVLTGEAEHQALARGFEVGTRFHSAPVVRLADAKVDRIDRDDGSRRPLPPDRVRRPRRPGGAGLEDPRALRIPRRNRRIRPCVGTPGRARDIDSVIDLRVGVPAKPSRR